MSNDSKRPADRMTTNFPTAPLAPGHKGAGGGTMEKSLSASHTEILTPPLAATFSLHNFLHFAEIIFDSWP